MKASRLAAVGLLVGAGLWIGSGYLVPHGGEQSQAAVKPSDPAPEMLFRVSVVTAPTVPHSRKLILSGRTEADRKVMVTTRATGIVTEVRVRRGDNVKNGDVIAILSDEAREAQVAQAQALVTQRRTELEAKRKLIASGTLPRLDLVDLEAKLKTAEAMIATAIAERDRGIVRAPWSGIVTEVPVEVGRTAFSMAGQEIAQLVSLDPMLTVVEVSERQLAGVKVGDKADVRLVTGETVSGKIRFVSKSASATTRTYRVEVEIANPDGAIPDGITAEVAIRLSPKPATRIARSALTFSSKGELGVRTVGDGGVVGFAPVKPLEDEQGFMWVSGIADGALVIVEGQDFVREGQRVSPVQANAAISAAQ